MKLDRSTKMRVLSFVAAAGAAAATRWALRRSWTAGTGQEPPENPAEPGVSWRAALAWGAASGMTVGAARILTHRITAEAAGAMD